MKPWMKFLETLAGKLTAILAFASIVIVVLALIGGRIPAEYRPLVYVVAIGAMVIFALQIFMRRKHTSSPAPISPITEKDIADSQQKRTRKDSSDARTDYLNAVIADCRALRLVGLDPQAADPSRGGLTLESLYISLNTTTILERDKKGKLTRTVAGSKEEEFAALASLRGEQQPLSALEALYEAEKNCMVLLGLPGTGKSTFVRYLALRMAQAETDRRKNIQDLLPGWKAGTVIPLIISLGRLAETIPSRRQKGSADLIEDFVLQTLTSDERMAGFAGNILSELQKVGGLVLFDGLDEVANLEMRPIVVQAIEDFVQKYGRNSSSRFLVTSRTYSYRNDEKWQLAGWPTHEIALLDEGKIKIFVNAWHDEHIRIDPARKPDLERKREMLLLSLQPDDRRRLHEIAPFPIILTMMAVVHTHYGELPDTRAEVYERCVDLLLVRWELERPVMGQPKKTQKRTIVDELGVSRVTLDRALWEIAYEAHAGRGDDGGKKRGPALVTEELLTSILHKHFKDLSKVQVFLDYCQSSNGLLMFQGAVTTANASADEPQSRVYAFPHLTFEEFLAARHLIRPNFGKTTYNLVQKSDRWREVVILLGEYLCNVHKDQERMEILLKAFTPERLPTKADSPVWRAVWYAGDLLSLYRRAFSSQESESESGITKGLKKLVFKNALSHAERASAADTLDELGYPLPDLSSFVPLVGRNGIPPYWISKYPITNLQYERFLKRENFENKELWCGFEKFDENSQPMKETWGEAGWKWLQETINDKDYETQDGVLLPRYWRDARFGSSRRHAPVVGISWYEASAYCNWLLENWDNLEEGKGGMPKPGLIRLPRDVEWAEAAGGDKDEKRYPWDKAKHTEKLEEILARANVSESQINRTTPVWMYPLGESVNGVMDMAGNVWEWQANYSGHEYGGQKTLGLRGGSWYGDDDVARVAFRNDFLPDGRGYGIGFRVALLPSG